MLVNTRVACSISWAVPRAALCCGLDFKAILEDTRCLNIVSCFFGQDLIIGGVKSRLDIESLDTGG